MDAVDIIKGILPVIGTALGGPFGAAAASFIGSKIGIPDATVKEVTEVLSGMPSDKLIELKQADQEFQYKMAALGYDSVAKLEELNVRVIESVNKTMQAETVAEHWPSYSWRPFIGFSFGFYINSLWLLPLFRIAPVIISPDMVVAITAVLGVASWFRGKAQANPEIQNTPTITQKG